MWRPVVPVEIADVRRFGEESPDAFASKVVQPRDRHATPATGAKKTARKRLATERNLINLTILVGDREPGIDAPFTGRVVIYGGIIMILAQDFQLGSGGEHTGWQLRTAGLAYDGHTDQVRLTGSSQEDRTIPVWHDWKPVRELEEADGWLRT